jgi:Protein of unknown function (DUF1592)/Protein of unknown function (DUF1588)
LNGLVGVIGMDFYPTRLASPTSQWNPPASMPPLKLPCAPFWFRPISSSAWNTIPKAPIRAAFIALRIWPWHHALSFFLWSSIPDAELESLAEKGRLHDRSVLEEQVRRMLADPKSKALVDNFAGQWLRLRNIDAWQPDPDKFKQFDDSLRESMRKESEMFVSYIIHDDHSVLELIDANYTFVNERLARHYQIPNVHGNYFRRVDLDGPERGGILTQSGILMVTAYPTRTSPVLRGKWILGSLLGAPPPRPPPGAGQFAEESSVGSPKNMREQLEKHRANIACATAHGPARIRTGKLRPNRPLPHQGWRCADRRFRLFARRCAG